MKTTGGRALMSLFRRLLAPSIPARNDAGVVGSLFDKMTFSHPDIGLLNKASDTDFFVISSPKCGGTAIKRGLERCGHAVIHAHTNITTWDAVSNGDVLRANNVGMEHVLQERLIASSRPLYLFFGYRDPVSWYLSLGAMWRWELGAPLQDYMFYLMKSTLPWCNYQIDDIAAIYLQAFDIDILKHKFDHKRGFKLIKKKNINVIVYRFDRLLSVRDYIVDNVSSGFALFPERVNEDPAYNAYKAGFRPPEAAVDSVRDDAWFQYFYTPEERESLIRSWSG